MIRLLPFAALLALTPVGAAAQRTHSVVIDRMAFGVVPAGVRAGDRITWINRDLVRHTATAPGWFDIDLAPGASRTIVIKKAGTMTVRCKYHPGMRTRMNVKAR